jgi:two-component system, cell cycle response regulator
MSELEHIGGPAASRIALLEDDPSLARLIDLALSKKGYTISTAATLAEARETFGVSWDLLICDRRLPDGDGLELCEEAKEHTGARFRYVIVLSGDDDESSKLQGFDRGADDYMSKPFSVPELIARVRAGLRIVELQKALIASNQRLEKLSRTDELTSLANRRHFQEEFCRAYEHAERYGRPLSLAMIDVDHFKTINDEHGHETGDLVLERVAAVLRENVRSSDFVARIGGEEFAMILPETQLHEAVVVSEKIRRAIAEQNADDTPRATVSVGVSSLPHSHFISRREMLRSSDLALYRAKERGRDRVEIERRSYPNRPKVTPPIRPAAQL